MRATALCLAVILLSGCASGPWDALPRPGERVYVHDDGRRVEGALVSIDDSLVIRTDTGAAVIAPTPLLLHRRVGGVSRGTGFAVGGAIGGVGGAASGAAIAIGLSGDDGAAVTGGIMLGFLGMLLGGGIGALFTGYEWESVRLVATVGSGVSDPDAVVVGIEARF